MFVSSTRNTLRAAAGFSALAALVLTGCSGGDGALGAFPDASTTGSADASSPADDGGAPRGDAGVDPSDGGPRDGGDGGGRGGAAPIIVSFDTSARTLTQGQTVKFSLVVTDPDGIDDLIGGTLNDPTSGDAYGTFATSAAEGAYSLQLSWDEINRTRMIEFLGTQATREFEARMFDVAAHRVTRRVTLTLSCPSGGACSGSCVSLATDSHCGTCATQCGQNESCSAQMKCACDPGARRCGTSCVLDSPFSLDRCGAACATCKADDTCDGSSCKTPVDGDLRTARDGAVEAYHNGEWRGLCDTYFWGQDMEVVCRQMGRGAFRNTSSSVTRSTATFWVYDPGCKGTESRLTDCPDFRWLDKPEPFCHPADYVARISCEK